MNSSFPKQIFRANDIRGIAGTEITQDFSVALGATFGKKARELGQNSVMVCRDARNSSPELQKALVRGLNSAGCELIDLGIGPTPLLGYALATSDLTSSGIMITASHNPSNQNGFKMCLNGRPFFGEELAKFYDELSLPDLDVESLDNKSLKLSQDYINSLKEGFDDLSGLKIVVDAGNGAAGPLAVSAFSSLGLNVIEQFCELDGDFPNRSPDTSKAANLEKLCQRVINEKADAGIGFDGDGDRMVAVTESGRLLDADDLISVFAVGVLKEKPGDKIVYDVKCSSSVSKKIASLGGKGLMERSGRSYLYTLMKNENAAFAGEYSAHYFFADRWYGTDDGIYAACRLLELCKQHGQSLEQICPPVSGKVATGEIYLPVPEAEKFAIIDAIVGYQEKELEIDNETPTVILVDGLRVEYEKGWALVRASNTEAALTLRFEATNEQFMVDLKDKIVSLLKTVSAEIETDGIEHVS